MVGMSMRTWRTEVCDSMTLSRQPWRRRCLANHPKIELTLGKRNNERIISGAPMQHGVSIPQSFRKGAPSALSMIPDLIKITAIFALL